MTVFSRLLAALTVAGLCVSTASVEAGAKEMFLIDFAHESDGNLHHGTLSMIDGTVRVTWTIDVNGQRKSRDVPMSEVAFRSAWDGLNDVPEFRNAIVDPGAHLDFRTHHVVLITFRLSGQEDTRTFAIQATSASAAYNVWLTKIGYSGK